MAIFFLFFGRLYYSCQQVVTTSPDAFIMRVEGGCVLLSAIEKGGAPDVQREGPTAKRNKRWRCCYFPLAKFSFLPKLKQTFFLFFFLFPEFFKVFCFPFSTSMELKAINPQSSWSCWALIFRLIFIFSRKLDENNNKKGRARRIGVERETSWIFKGGRHLERRKESQTTPFYN